MKIIVTKCLYSLKIRIRMHVYNVTSDRTEITKEDVGLHVENHIKDKIISLADL